MRPKILTEDLFSRFLADSVILDYLRDVSDLDADLSTADEGLVDARKDLRLYVFSIEREVLSKFSNRSGNQPLGAFGVLRGLGVRLRGYREVTEQQITDGTEPTLPDGTSYEAGDPNPKTMDTDLLFALRKTIADVAEHDTGLPPRHLESKSQGGSSETYNTARRPTSLYRHLRPFDTRRLRF